MLGPRDTRNGILHEWLGVCIYICIAANIGAANLPKRFGAVRCESAPIHTCRGMHTLVLGIHSDSHEQSILQHDPQYEELTNWSDPTIIPHPYSDPSQIWTRSHFLGGEPPPVMWFIMVIGGPWDDPAAPSGPRQMFRKLCEIPTPHDGRTVPRPDSPVAAAKRAAEGGWGCEEG